MRIEQLQYLDAVIRCGSMRRAGEELHLSQPALSESIRNLERELGVTLLDRRRSGAKISAAGRELLPFLAEVLESVERLRAAAGDQDRSGRTVRIGTVHAATVPLVAPAIHDFHREHPDIQVEVRTCQQSEIRDGLQDGTLDIGLVNLMAGDESPAELSHVDLVHGRAVVCCRPDSAVAALDVVGADDLLVDPFVFMRPGYVMRRYVDRLLGTRRPAVSYSADGAEMGKTMVAEGLGITVLPDYSVVGDPLQKFGVITTRPLADPGAGVVLVMQGRRSRHRSTVVRALEDAFVRRAGQPLPDNASVTVSTEWQPDGLSARHLPVGHGTV